MKSILRLLFACAMSLLVTSAALAQAFPSRPIKLFVPFPPGGAADIFARQLGAGLSTSLKQPVVVENLAGAGGTLAIEQTLRAPADGYTWVLNSAGTVAIAPSVRSLSYDPMKDLALVTLVAKVPQVIVVGTAVPANNLKELIAHSKAHPGTVNYASSGAGSISHLAGELLKFETKTDFTHIPYKGATPALNDLLGGQVQLAILDVSLVLPHITNGKLKALAITSNERVSALAQVPTTGELGFPKVNSDNWFGLVGSSKIPADIQQRVQEAAFATLKQPAVVESFSKLPATAIPSTPAEYRKFLVEEHAKWGNIIKTIGYKE